MTRSRTPQQYDPLGALGSRPLAIIIAFGSVVWAGIESVFARDVPGVPTMSAVTVLLVAGSAAVVAMGTSPFRAPFSRPAFVAHVALLGLATCTSVAAQWGPDRSHANDFMVLVSALGVIVMAPYRPWTDLLVGGAALSVVAGAAFGVGAAAFPTEISPGVSVLLAACPTLVLTAASVGFGAAFVALAERVQIRAGSYSVERAERDGIAELVRQDRSAILANEVAPFLAELRTRETISDVDRERARAIADGIRRVMVADADRTWLDQALVADGAEAATVDDPAALIRTMDVDQRTVFRTFVRAVLRATTVDPAGLRIAVADARGSGDAATPDRSAPDRVCVRVEVDVADSDVGIHRTFDPYLAVLRVTFPDLDAAVRPSALALGFSYDQH